MTNNKANLLFMAFSGRTSESSVISRYSGVGAVKVLAINPTREKWNELMGGDSTTPIEYVGTKVDNSKTIATARVTFITQVEDLRAPDIKNIIPITFFLENRYHITQNNTCEVIDRFGRTAYADEATLKAHKDIYYGDFKAKIETASYRPALVGEASLVAFIKAFRNILEVETYNAEKKVFVEEKDENILATRVAMLDNPKALFNGDFSEVKGAIEEFPDNKVKVMFGVRHNDGKDYQDFFNGYFMRAAQNSLAPMVKNVTDSKNAGRYPNTDFDFNIIHVWEPKATNFEDKPKSFDFGNPADSLKPSDKEDNKEPVDDLPFGDNPWGI